ncbi:MAG: hypothetical protein G01um101419_322 [Parcubacteria group bacterium Gr01-1014_19]|nr:MAG: hypothetical protein G01um101419_322 [Parcubacteria group bacterium Gr01-1014_19]
METAKSMMLARLLAVTGVAEGRARKAEHLRRSLDVVNALATAAGEMIDPTTKLLVESKRLAIETEQKLHAELTKTEDELVMKNMSHDEIEQVADYYESNAHRSYKDALGKARIACDKLVDDTQSALDAKLMELEVKALGSQG